MLWIYYNNRIYVVVSQLFPSAIFKSSDSQIHLFFFFAVNNVYIIHVISENDYIKIDKNGLSPSSW